MPIAFEKFSELLSLRLRAPLPGPDAHEPLRAVPVGTVRPTFSHQTPPRPGSVLILLYQDGGQIKFPLTQRHEYAGAHSGQVSFPGGKSEEGETSEETALRESEEEIGVYRSDIQVIGRLTNFFVIPSNFLVTPVVAIHRTKPRFSPDPFEVARILEGTVEDLIREDAVQTKEITAARIYQLRAPHFLIDNEVVWGATAMMLNEFRSIMQDILRDA